MGQSPVSHDFQIGEWLVEPGLCRISRAGHVVHLRPKLVDFLVFLASNHGGMIGKDEILKQVWHGEFVVESVLARSVADLRHILGDNAATPRFIETIAKRGYRLIAPVRWTEVISRPVEPWVAVLPFANLAPGSDQQYFCDGLAEELTNTLCGVPGLRVIARTSAFAFRDRPMDVREIGRQLGVGAVVEGAVQRAKGRLRITVQLIDTAEGYHLWSQRFDRIAGDVFAIQDEIAQAVVAELEGTLLRKHESRLVRHHTRDSEAHDLYLRGRYVHARRTATALAEATAYFTRAIERDPDYALAHAALAECYSHGAFLGYLPPQEGFPKALAAARTAVQLDDTLAEGHTALAASLTFFCWQWQEAERSFRRAIELTPSYPAAHMGYSHLLAALGRAEEALEEAALAQQLDPLSPLPGVSIAMRFTEARQFERAMGQLQAIAAMDPGFGTVHLHLGRVCFVQEHYAEALAHLRHAPPDFPLALGLRGAALGRLGRRKEAIELLGRLARLSTERYVGAFPFALVHQGLGDLDTALHWYTKAFDAHEGILVEALVDPVTAVLRSDPRFAPLVQRMHLPEPDHRLVPDSTGA